MPYAISISYNTLAPSRHFRSYTLSIGRTDAPVTGKLQSSRVVFNNIATNHGVYATLKDALWDALSYLPDCAIVRFEQPDADLDGPEVYLRDPYTKARRLRDGARVVVLARKTDKGISINQGALEYA